MLAMSYGNVYVARVAMGANDTQTVKAIMEAERYNGPSIIIAYSHCIAHGYDLRNGLSQQKLAVRSGYWPIFRYNPDLIESEQNPFSLDCDRPTVPLKDYMYNETRFKMLTKTRPERAKQLLKLAEEHTASVWEKYENLAVKKQAEK